MLVKSARTFSHEIYLDERIYIGLTSYAALRVLRKYFAVQNLSSCSLPSAYTTGDSNTVFCIAWKMASWKQHK